ncbi:MAG: response regulator, partial [Anaerolineae bacterium]|nr:response regulator [Anaerolineae bacterium]
MPSEAKQQTRLQILVVDDEQEATSFCQQVLARSGYAVSTSGNPQQALQLLATMDIDLLVTDLRMPGMSGLELIETARQQRPDLVSIAIMGYADTIEIETAVRALRVGARGFLAKPFTIEQLRQPVDHALREAHLMREHDRLLTLMPLLDLSRSCIKARDIDALLAEGLAITCAALHGSAACFYRWHSDGEQLELFHRYGCDNLPLPDTGALASQLRSASEAIVLSTQQTEEGAPSQNVPQAIAPALATDGLIGALLIVRPQAATPFGRSDLETLTIMANQIATLYDNARLVQELESWDRRLERRVHEATEELIQAQERMIRTERLAAIGQLGASIAYELRNPLGAISNCVYYLRSRTDPDDSKAHRHLQIIQNEIGTVNDITNDLMSFARVGQLEIRPEDPTA